MKLTSRQIELSKPKGKTYSLADGGGLSLLVHTDGSKSWLFRYTRPNGTRNSISLGIYHKEINGLAMLDSNEINYASNYSRVLILVRRVKKVASLLLLNKKRLLKSRLRGWQGNGMPLNHLNGLRVMPKMLWKPLRKISSLMCQVGILPVSSPKSGSKSFVKLKVVVLLSY